MHGAAVGLHDVRQTHGALFALSAREVADMDTIPFKYHDGDFAERHRHHLT